MKIFLISLFIAAAVAAPLDGDTGEPVELIVNGVPEGQALEISDVLDIKVKEHANGEIAAVSNLLYPYSAQGIAEAAAAEEPTVPGSPVLVVENPQFNPIDVIPVLPLPNDPQPVVLPEPVLPEVVVEGVNVPEPVIVPEPVLVEEVPAIVPEPVLVEEGPAIVPEPVQVIESPEPVPAPAPLMPNGEVFNNGNVQVVVNTSEEPGLLATLQGWFNMAINYISNGMQTTQQIV